MVKLGMLKGWVYSNLGMLIFGYTRGWVYSNLGTLKGWVYSVGVCSVGVHSVGVYSNLGMLGEGMLGGDTLGGWADRWTLKLILKFLWSRIASVLCLGFPFQL